MQILLPKIISQSAADKLYPPQDDNTHYVVGYLNDRDPIMCVCLLLQDL